MNVVLFIICLVCGIALLGLGASQIFGLYLGEAFQATAKWWEYAIGAGLILSGIGLLVASGSLL